MFGLARCQVNVKGLESKVVRDILTAFHNGPTEGHHGANLTAKKSLIPIFISQLFTEMPMTWSHGVTLVNSWQIIAT
nr:hypothetical protein [Tanacetum cinerariifolium]